MKYRSQHPAWFAQTHGRHDFHESPEYMLRCREREIRGRARWSWTSATSERRRTPSRSCAPVRSTASVSCSHTKEARSLGGTLLAHADSAEGPDAGRERLLGDVRAHFGQEVAVDVERLPNRQFRSSRLDGCESV